MLHRPVAFARHRLSILDAEEILNSLTHGFGLVASTVGSLLLVLFAARTQDPWRVVGAAVFGLSLVFLYGASTVYHGVTGPLWKPRLRRVDHFGVTLLIAGSYTPFMLTFMRDSPAIWAGIAVWLLVGVGVVMQLVLTEKRYYQASLALYLAMGFVCLPVLTHLLDGLPPGAIHALALGGVLYIVGVAFFVWESLPFSHGIWHLFVLGGSGVHFGAVLRYAVWG